MKKTQRLICALATSIHLAGCTTLSTIPYTSDALENQPIRLGEHVVLSTKAPYDKHELVVTSLTTEQVCGKDGCVRTEDIAWIERKEFSASKTIALIAAAGIVGLLLHSMATFGPMQLSSFR